MKLLFYLFVISDISILMSENNALTRDTCTYDYNGMFWTFNSGTIFNQYRLRRCQQNSTLCSANSTDNDCVNKGNGIFRCRFLSPEKEMEVLSRYKNTSWKVNIIGRSSSEADFQFLSNFNVSLIMCISNDCLPNKQKATITKKGKRHIFVRYNLYRYNRIHTFGTSENLKTKVIRSIRGNEDIEIDDPCGVYKICVTTVWVDCSTNYTRIQIGVHCQTVYADYTPLPPDFSCRYDDTKKKLKLFSDKI